MNVIKLPTEKHNRIGFIGGSDATRIMRGDWYDLYMEKTGQAAPDDLSNQFNVQLGVATEGFNLDWFTKEYNLNPDYLARSQTYSTTVGDVPYVGQLDAVYSNAKGKVKFGVECKHTYSYNSFNKVAQYYMAQIQFYMYISGADKIYLSVIFGNHWECKSIARHNDYIDVMHSKIWNFWNHVKNKTEPEDNSTEDISINNFVVDELITTDASKNNEFMDLTHTFFHTRDSHKQHEKSKKELKKFVKKNEREVFNQYISIRKDKRGALRIIELKELET